MANNRVTKSYDYNVICDVCGFKKKASEVRKRWDGFWVCPEDWEQRHIADFYQTRNDVHTLPFTRPDTDSQRAAFLKLGTESVTGAGVWTTTQNYAISATPSSDWCNNSGQSMTIMAWIKLNTAASAHQLVVGNAALNSIGTWKLTVGGGNTSLQPNHGVVFSVGDGAAVNINVTSISDVLVPFKWHHVAVTRLGSTKATIIYVDGVPVRTNAYRLDNANSPVVNNTDLIYMGKLGASTNPANISIADVRYFSASSFSACLSLDQVRSNMARDFPNLIGALPEPSTYLRAWWKCDDNSTTTIADSTGLGNDLTISTATDVSWATKGIH